MEAIEKRRTTSLSRRKFLGLLGKAAAVASVGVGLVATGAQAVEKLAANKRMVRFPNGTRMVPSDWQTSEPKWETIEVAAGVVNHRAQTLMALLKGIPVT